MPFRSRNKASNVHKNLRPEVLILCAQNITFRKTINRWLCFPLTLFVKHQQLTAVWPTLKPKWQWWHHKMPLTSRYLHEWHCQTHLPRNVGRDLKLFFKLMGTTTMFLEWFGMQEQNGRNRNTAGLFQLFQLFLLYLLLLLLSSLLLLLSLLSLLLLLFEWPWRRTFETCWWSH